MSSGTHDHQVTSITTDPIGRVDRIWLRLIVVIGGLGLVCATLFPFAPELPGPSMDDWKAEIARRVEWQFPSRGGIEDLVGNMLLFVPFGFGLGGALLAHSGRSVRTIATTVVATAALSIAIEVVQLLIPSRDPAVGDIVGNTIGGLVGAIAFCLVGRSVLRGLTKLTAKRESEYLSGRKLALAFVAYAVIVFAGSLMAARTQPLAAWDADMPLRVGSEQGDQGDVISDLLVADRAMTADEIDRGVQQLRTGANPAPQGVIGFYPLQDHPRHKPCTDGREISRQIAASSRFTVSALVSPGEVSQDEQSRITSLARTAEEVNLTLSRNVHFLVSLRTPLTSSGGARPQFLLPYLFADGKAHHVAVSFDGRRLRTYADGKESGIVDMSSELAFVSNLLPFHPAHVVLGRTDTRVWRLGFDLVVFAPLGLLAGLVLGRAALPFHSRAGWALAMVFMPPIALQLGIAGVQARGLDWTNYGSAAATAAIAAAIAMMCGIGAQQGSDSP